MKKAAAGAAVVTYMYSVCACREAAMPTIQTHREALPHDINLI